MSGEATILVATTLYCLVHSLLAMDRTKVLARRLVGDQAYRWYRLAYNVFAGVSALPIIALMAWNPGSVLWSIPAPLVYATLVVQLLCLLAMAWAVGLVGAGDFLGLGVIWPRRKTAAAAGLVTGGAYRYVRHPLYSLGLVLLWLNPSMTTGALAIAVTLTVYLVLGTYIEEKRMLAQFGDEYARYRRQTPRLVPVPAAWRSSGFDQVHLVYVLLGLLGLAVSLYLTASRISPGEVELYCSVSGPLNCEQVTSSPQSTLLGVPVSALGAVWFAALLALVGLSIWRPGAVPRLARLLWCSAGLAFVAYLVYSELFVIGAICEWCTTTHVAVVLLFILTLREQMRYSRSGSRTMTSS